MIILSCYQFIDKNLTPNFYSNYLVFKNYVQFDFVIASKTFSLDKSGGGAERPKFGC